MSKVTIIRKAYFNAAHRLHVEQWDEEKNKSVFGLCNNPNYHGHNYELDVFITGEVDPISGMVLDVKEIKDKVESLITKPFDHKNLNVDVLDFKELNPTVENIAMVIWNKLRTAFAPELDIKVRLAETPRNIVEFDGK